MLSRLISSMRHKKIFIKEFSYFLMSCHQHCLGATSLFRGSLICMVVTVLATSCSVSAMFMLRKCHVYNLQVMMF